MFVAHGPVYGAGAYDWAGCDYLVAGGGAVPEGSCSGGYAAMASVAGCVCFWPGLCPLRMHGMLTCYYW